MSRRPTLLLLNHFGLQTICGSTVMLEELLRVAPVAAPEVEYIFHSYDSYQSPSDMLAWLNNAHGSFDCIVALNAHIEVAWDFSEQVFQWCSDRGVRAYVYIHDYWPHHRVAMFTLSSILGGSLLASSPFIASELMHEGFQSLVVQTGVPLPDIWPAATSLTEPKIMASAARLVPRKRIADIALAFAESKLDGHVQLYLRLLPSKVFTISSDLGLQSQIESIIEKHKLSSVVIDSQASNLPKYAQYAAYICSSSYEGFSMAVIEAAFHACPPLMSDIPPHCENADLMFGERACDFLYPMGDYRVLAAKLHDEWKSGRRKAFLEANLTDIRNTIAERWSLKNTARALAAILLSFSDG